MNPVGIIDILALAGSLCALAVAFLFGRGRLGRNIHVVLVFFLMMGVAHTLSNIIQWAGIGRFPEALENSLEVMWAISWPLLVLSFLREQSEQDLSESEERYKMLVERNHAGVAVAQGGKLVFANQRMVEITGRTLQELIGHSPLDLLDPEDAPVMERNMSNRQAGLPASDRYTVRLLRKDGEVRHLDLMASLISWEGRPASLASVVDVTERKRIERELMESERRFRTVFDDSPESVSLSRLDDGNFLDINRTFLSMLGLKKEDVVGRSSLEIGLWLDRRNRDEFRRILAKNGEIENFETVFRFAGGVLHPVLVSAKIISSIGPPLILAIVRDISILKEAQTSVRRSLEEKEILLREIHHRVKNNLQVISGLLGLQAHHINDQRSREIYKESQNRVISMALIHESLYQSKNLARIDFCEYLRQLAGNLFASYGVAEGKIALTLEAQGIPMVIDTAIPCGLIVNELITNSIKHAFPEGRCGKIHVGLRLLDGEGPYELTVADDGVGFPMDHDFPISRTLGLKLVQVIVEQLGGTLEMRGDSGGRFKIRFNEYREAGSKLI